MRLNEKNAKFAVVKTAFHGGGIVSYHNSLDEALKSERKYASGDCTCGCCRVIPITGEAQKELFERGYSSQYAALLEEIPQYSGNESSPYTICK